MCAHKYIHTQCMCMCVCIYICICVWIYIYISILVIRLYVRLWAWLVPCSGVSVVDFEQVNAGWVLVVLITRFLLTNDSFNWFIYSVVIFCSIRFIFYCKYTNFNNYVICIKEIGPAFCCNQSVYLHCRLIGWFLHGAGFGLVGIF